MSEQEGPIKKRYEWTEAVKKGSTLRANYGDGPFEEATSPEGIRLRPGNVAIKIGERIVRRKRVRMTLDTFAVLSNMYLRELK